MSATALLLVAIAAFVVAYAPYGRLLARWRGVAPQRRPPAHEQADGVDYVPARAPVLLGHHFASIAGAAPIIGPVTALAFGWLPVYLWVLLGGIFFGAVHDFASLMASLRHGGRSIGELVEQHLGYLGKTLFLLFSWATLILVVAVFAIVVAKTFVKVPQAATASALFITVALVFGVLVYRVKVPLAPATVGGVVLLGGSLVAGHYLPLALSFDAWVAILLVYVFIASVTPVWLLLQPRDYLNSFLLYAMLGLGVAGIVVANPTIAAPPTTGFTVEGLGTLFPVLFVTVACGAISGFHSLVASGTTAKQLNNEADALPVGYGGMLIESLLAVVALVAVGFMTAQRYQGFVGPGGGGPVAAFSAGLGELIGALGLPVDVATNFVALAVSAFALTTLDTATRLARFAFQEFFEPRRELSGASKVPQRVAAPAGEDKAQQAGRPSGLRSLLARNRFIGTAISVAAAGALAYSGTWKQIWPIFGSANQLLAALALLAVSVWLAHRSRRNAFVVLPMIGMFAVTLSSLGLLVYHHLLQPQGKVVLGVFAVLLLAVALVLAGMAARALLTSRKATETAS